ncbi:hypothetical protein BB776_04130 [Planococcus salinarum]|uniref:Uncharacterized protein n=1 Tax=Planococcus salinarum TaxID=622695 RepID=A0ABX3CX56_9BACL|nr:hypothetical protein [Planococcus salinarum]OHX49893.1 hypothetical protein BB776_04130 [Planococcus salinarum]
MYLLPDSKLNRERSVDGHSRLSAVFNKMAHIHKNSPGVMPGLLQLVEKETLKSIFRKTASLAWGLALS